MSVWLLGLPVIVVGAILARIAARRGRRAGYLMAAMSVIVLAAAVVLLAVAAGPAEPRSVHKQPGLEQPAAAQRR